MKRMEQTNSSSITHLFIYALAFLLLWEWLRPIPTITDTSYIEVFVFFAFFSCVLIFLRVSPYLMVPTLFLGSIYCLHYIFHEGAFFSREGGMETIRFFLSDGWYNIKLIFSAYHCRILNDALQDGTEHHITPGFHHSWQQQGKKRSLRLL